MSVKRVKSSASSKELPEAETAGMNVLNDDCLMYIIQFLPIVDRVRIERVSKRWRTISRSSWHSFNHLKLFENDCWGFREPETLTEKVNYRVVQKILYFCGKFLISISFPSYSSSFMKGIVGKNILSNVAKLCRNIRCIDTQNLSVSSRDVSVLSENCAKLVSIALECSSGADWENNFSLLLTRNKNLKSLEIEVLGSKFTGKCLKELNGDLVESISIYYCDDVTHENLYVIRNFCKLRKLELDFFEHLNNDVMEDISSSYKTLECLRLSRCPSNGTTNFINEISKLKNLASLNLWANDLVNDMALKTICSCCRLIKEVNIGACELVTNEGVTSVISLPKLEILDITNLHNITDQVFLGRAIPTLQRVNCSWCRNIRDAGLVNLIEGSENMEHLNASFCSDISIELLEEAVRVMRKRKNQVVLTLDVRKTNLLMHNVSSTSPFLRVLY